jgi:hypothetical protein
MVSAQAAVFIPFHSIKSVDRDGRPWSEAIDKAWYAALNATGDPEAKVAFYLSDLTSRPPPAEGGSERIFDASGDLVLAGVTNSLILPARILPMGNGKFKISGTTSFRWVSRAVRAFSTFTGGEHFTPDSRITVKFEWLVGPTNTPIAIAEEGLVPLYLELPAPRFKAAPRDVKFGSYVEPFPEMPRAPMLTACHDQPGRRPKCYVQRQEYARGCAWQNHRWRQGRHRSENYLPPKGNAVGAN